MLSIAFFHFCFSFSRSFKTILISYFISPHSFYTASSSLSFSPTTLLPSYRTLTSSVDLSFTSLSLCSNSSLSSAVIACSRFSSSILSFKV